MQRLRLVLLCILLLVPVLPAGGQALDADLFTLSGQVRHRSELDARAPEADVLDLHLLRTRLGVGVVPAENVEVFVQLQDARLFGGENPSAGRGTMDGDADQIDLHQAYFAVSDFFGTPVRLQVGRQELVYGNQRLVGAVGWSNIGRTFDAAVAGVAREGVAIDLFAARLVSYLEGGEDASENLFGLYSTWQLAEDHALDAFVLLDNDTRGIAEVGRQDENRLTRYTPGVYLYGQSGTFDYEAEAIYQGGTIADTDVRAYLLSGSAGVTLGAGHPVRVAATYTRLSGNDPAEEHYGAFSTLFATNHKFYGYMDYFLGPAFQEGLQDAFVSFGTRLSDQVTLGLDAHYFATAVPAELRSEENEVYEASDLGQELDLTLGYRYNEAFTVTAGASAFRPGDVMENDLRFGIDEVTYWAYLMTSVTF